MLKACKYCGRIHSKKYVCEKKPIKKYQKQTEMSRFRSTKEWTQKSIEIRERDKYLCQICVRNLHHTQRQYMYDGLSVHHAIPIATDWERRLDNDNLITLCSMHHEMAENGEIPYEEIRSIIDEQEKIPPGDLG